MGMTDTNKLKRVAERLGHDVQMAHEGKVVTIKQERRWGDHAEFNPYKNPAQLVECIEWLLGQGWELEKLDDLYRIKHYEQNISYNEGTLAEAVINAIAGEDDE